MQTFLYVRSSTRYSHKNLGKIVGKKRQLNRVLMHFMKNRDVFAQKRQNLVFHALLYVGREFHKVEEIIQNINHRISIII